jgi:hypothetical protein
VVPSAKDLKAFALNQGSAFIGLRLDGKKSGSQIWLRPTATYKGLQCPIYLENSPQIRLSIEQDDGNPVISVDKNGLIHALHEGKALIIGDFDGVKDRVQVSVRSSANQRQR